MVLWGAAAGNCVAAAPSSQRGSDLVPSLGDKNQSPGCALQKGTTATSL